MAGAVPIGVGRLLEEGGGACATVLSALSPARAGTMDFRSRSVPGTTSCEDARPSSRNTAHTWRSSSGVHRIVRSDSPVRSFVAVTSPGETTDGIAVFPTSNLMLVQFEFSHWMTRWLCSRDRGFIKLLVRLLQIFLGLLALVLLSTRSSDS